jgi:hypothetical protein
MPLNLASPGIIVKEVDLTTGRVNPVSDKIGAIVAPFTKGPTGTPTIVETENDLRNIFGDPYPTDKHYEHWLVASSYLAYGGSLRVVRSDDQDLRNSFVGTASSIKIKSLEHYNQLGYSENTITGVTVAAQNPGSWADGIQVAIIDGFADQILTIPTTGPAVVGYGVTQTFNKVLSGVGTTSTGTGYLKGIVTGVGAAAGLSTNQVAVKVLSIVDGSGGETAVDYQQNGNYLFSTGSNTISLVNSVNAVVAIATVSASADWFDAQRINVTTQFAGSTGVTTIATINWNNIAQKPSTSEYSATRGGRFDEVHVVLIDSNGAITGNAGTVLEKHLALSKASDAQYSVGSPSNWRMYLAEQSDYIFGGSQPTGITTCGFQTAFVGTTDNDWDQAASGIIFGSVGNTVLTLNGGKNYNGLTDITSTGALTATIGNISTGYELFEKTDTYKVDFLLMGSANYDVFSARALAQKLIEVAELRKDAIAFISPYRGAFLADSSVGSVTVSDDTEITDNIISYYSPITSSTYAVFDGSYKYMYDRFSNTFRYVPLNGDIAGLCARTDINNFPWYSPAGTSRGAILNAVKLAYNPTKSQRDRLYTNRINPITVSAGAGIILFGDKTGYAKASAFDRINVRRLFIYLENAISAAAKDQLFEFNDEITRTNFVNIVEPFLRDVKAKRGVYDYVVVCDETNNTGAIIDANEFVADIYIKPARSINFIGLTFVATRTGVAFEEVIGKF